MIISKLNFTEEEKKRLKHSTSSTEIGMINARASQRYILSFGKGVNITYESIIEGEPPIFKLSDNDSQKVRQAILSDVHEILNAITKEEVEEQIKNKDWSFFRNAVNEDGKPVDPDGQLEKKFKTPCWGTCWGIFQEILALQMTTYDYYRLNNMELIELFQKKAEEWYEPPTLPDSTDDKNDKKKEIDSGKIEELPSIQRVKKPESVCYPLFKPTYILFNNFPIGKTKKLNAASEADKRKGKAANILLLLNFDELEGVKISRPLTIYDKSVWNACANLARYGYETVTARDVYRFMGYNNNLNQRDKKKILESIETIIRARVFISNKEEHALYKKYDEISLNTPLLSAEICKAKIGNTVVEEAIRIIEPPKLFAIAEKRGQVTTIPFKVLESPINKNDDIALIIDYLITRISRMKNSKNMTRTILLDTLYDKCNITDSASDRVKKTRLPEKIDRLLEHYKSVGWIGNYQMTKNEIIIIPENN